VVLCRIKQQIVPDWWQAAVRFEHALQAARGLGAGSADTHLADAAVRGVERAKWRLWHGLWPGCRRKLAAPGRWTQRNHVRDAAGIGRLQRHINDLLGYVDGNDGALVHYAARRRRGEPISRLSWRVRSTRSWPSVRTRQQMRWSRTTVQPFLDVRTEGAERHARRRLPSLLSRLPPHERQRGNRSGSVINLTSLHAPET
jgi:hypothetical protein